MACITLLLCTMNLVYFESITYRWCYKSSRALNVLIYGMMKILPTFLIFLTFISVFKALTRSSEIKGLRQRATDRVGKLKKY